MPDDIDLDRFVAAQDQWGTYVQALTELRGGRKRGHWIWFVFPQLAGLGRSPTSQEFGVRGLAEARAYLAHPVLGPRLLECADALLALDGDDPEAVLGGIDAMKVRSSMTMFEAADASLRQPPAVLEKYYGGVRDDATLGLLGRS